MEGKGEESKGEGEWGWMRVREEESEGEGERGWKREREEENERGE